MNATQYVIVLSRDNDGPTYLGRLDLGRQGVRRLENALRYKTSGRARNVARDYPGATVEPAPASELVKTWKVEKTAEGVCLTLNGHQYRLGDSAHPMVFDLYLATAPAAK